MNQPRSEHPKPQFYRKDWICLNGTWDYKVSNHLMKNMEELTGTHFKPLSLVRFEKRKITVPFVPESKLSGIGDTNLTSMQQYSKEIRIPKNWEGMNVNIHFGGVYYYAKIFLDGNFVGYHAGGSVSFHFDLTPYVKYGQVQNLLVDVYNNIWNGTQPSGKQSWKNESYGCFYTRSTGIWQSVWLEKVHPQGLKDIQILPDLDGGTFTFIPRFIATEKGNTWKANVFEGTNKVSEYIASSFDGNPIKVDVASPKSWSPESPFLYKFIFEVMDNNGQLLDTVGSYGALRKIHIEGNTFFLNNKPYFQRLVLDQGFYPDGIWTAPSDEALKNDIVLAKEAGFNGARLHQKVFEERFLYWADTLGYIVWGESASWGIDYNQDGLPHRNFLSEWREIVQRDRNHPCIVAWTPFNETRVFTNPISHKRIHEEAYNICKAIDPTRPVNDASGYIHHITDIYTVHNYKQDPEELRELLARKKDGSVFQNFPDSDSPYKGQPYYIDEFGGIKWAPSFNEDLDTSASSRKKSWGYGEPPGSLDDFYKRLESLVKVIQDTPHIVGWCYTQLTDVEQEQNGIYFYDRTVKFDMERIKEIFQMPKNGYDN